MPKDFKPTWKYLIEKGKKILGKLSDMKRLQSLQKIYLGELSSIVFPRIRIFFGYSRRTSQSKIISTRKVM